MKILVTGGAGFIGSHIVRACLDADHEVAVIDNLSHGKRENVDSRAEFFEVDITREFDVNRVMGTFRPDVVSHQAAEVDVAWCEENQAAAHAVNVRGTAIVAYAAAIAGARRIVFASSVGGYGECAAPAVEGGRLEPIGAYGRTKSDAEAFLGSRIPSNLHVTILRYSNVYGSGASGGVVRTFIEAWARQERPTIYGDGEQVRDFIHVDDVALANVLALEQDDEAGWMPRWQVFNVASGNPITINRLWAMISAAHVDARPVDIVESRVSPNEIRERLGFVNAIDLQQGLGKLMLTGVAGDA